MNPHDKIRKAILDEGNGGLHADEIVYATGLNEATVQSQIAVMATAGQLTECDPGCYMVAN